MVNGCEHWRGYVAVSGMAMNYTATRDTGLNGHGISMSTRLLLHKEMIYVKLKQNRLFCERMEMRK